MRLARYLLVLVQCCSAAGAQRPDEHRPSRSILRTGCDRRAAQIRAVAAPSHLRLRQPVSSLALDMLTVIALGAGLALLAFALLQYLARGISAGVRWGHVLREVMLGRSIVTVAGWTADWLGGRSRRPAATGTAVLRSVQRHPGAIPAGDGPDCRCAAGWMPGSRDQVSDICALDTAIFWADRRIYWHIDGAITGQHGVAGSPGSQRPPILRPRPACAPPCPQPIRRCH